MNTTSTNSTNSEQVESKQSDLIEFDKDFLDKFYDTCVKSYLLSGRKFY